MPSVIGTRPSRRGHGQTVPCAARFWPPCLVLNAPSLLPSSATPACSRFQKVRRPRAEPVLTRFPRDDPSLLHLSGPPARRLPPRSGAPAGCSDALCSRSRGPCPGQQRLRSVRVRLGPELPGVWVCVCSVKGPRRGLHGSPGRARASAFRRARVGSQPPRGGRRTAGRQHRGCAVGGRLCVWAPERRRQPDCARSGSQRQERRACTPVPGETRARLPSLPPRRGARPPCPEEPKSAQTPGFHAETTRCGLLASLSAKQPW